MSQTGTLDVTTLGTLDEIVEYAQSVVDPGPLTWAASGAGRSTTVARNSQAIERLALVPRLMQDVTAVSTATSFLGVPMSLPVFFSPVGSTVLFHPGATAELARGAAAFGASVFCPTLTRSSWEEVAATAPGRHFFQLYVQGDDAWVDDIVERVVRAGFAAICVTADSAVHAKRDSVTRGGFDWRLEREGMPPNLVPHGRDETYKANFTWAKFARLCATSPLPIILKGVLTAADARLAVDHGAAAVYVSNHGGRNVDSELSTIEALAAIIDEVAVNVPVVVDGGFLRAGDVLKALALGATAVGMGRLQCWALAAGGADAVEHVLDILQRDLATTMALLGCTSPDRITRDQVRGSFAPEIRTSQAG
ncbi:MAG TPA: alpha-hydroxy acid oxidase [Marmoricola sp.]|jgi:isopentenyl diphosphate isomerase/L-lactate dehydrogenase-like FMN-dependent dehydrogenase|nr:alpha-hydroxy acid oxidase [Marmoricola sp.]